MKLALITLFPEMSRAITDFGITQRAFAANIAELQCFNPRDFTKDKHRTVDDRPYGGGPGMVMKPEPLALAIASAKAWVGVSAPVVYLSPQGKPLTQPAVEQFSNDRALGLILLAGRYEGVDERLLNALVDHQYSLGDYVISGGELAAMTLMDAIIRTLPGALGHEASAAQDSFSGELAGLLDCPHYTRPENYEGADVPDVLLSGDHKRIAEWRKMQSLGRTHESRPDLLKDRPLAKSDQLLIDQYYQSKTERDR